MFEVELKAEEKSKGVGTAPESLTLIKRILESLSELVEQAEIKASSKGLSIQVMDLMHVALADVFLSHSMFTRYRCDRDITIGVQLKTLVRILKGMTLEENGLFKIECDDSATELIIKNIREGNTLSFKLKLFSFDSDAYNVPELEFGVDATIPSEDFMYIPKLIGTFGDFIGMKAEDRSITFFQAGGNADTSMTLEESGEKEGLKIDVKEAATLEIAMKYINLISKVAPLCEKVKISLGSNHPVLFSFVIGELAHIRFYIAPKMDSDQ